MKFKALSKFHRRWTLPHQTLLVMKLTTIIMIVAGLHLSAKGLSQERVTISEKNASLVSILKQIKAQTGYQYFFVQQWADEAKAVNIEVSNASLEEVLKICFQGQPFDYAIVKRTIVIREKEIRSRGNQVVSSLTSDKDLTGKVVNEKGDPVPGATVSVDGSSKLAITDDEGQFTLKRVDSNAILRVSSIGYENTTIEVRGKPAVFVMLKVKVASLGEANVSVFTGYQQIPKERATGSFSQPNKQMYDARVSTDVISKMEGITSGLVFNSPGITGKQTPKLSIRGRSTIYANDDPLIVIDNFPYDGDISNINPNDVENVTILKDAAASSIWGVRAGNGVIIITTKKGHLNQPFRIALNSNITISAVPNLLYNQNFLKSSDQIDVEQMLFGQGFYDNAINSRSFPVISPVVNILDQQRNGLLSSSEATAKIDALRSIDSRTDEAKYFYRKPLSQQYAINVSGGDQRDAYYLSLGYDNDKSTLVNNNYHRITVNSANDFSPLSRLIISTGINYIQTQTQSDGTLSELTGGGSYYPYTQVADQKGQPLNVTDGYNSNYIDASVSQGFLDWHFSPLQELRNGWNANARTGNYDLRLSAGAKYILFPGLNAEMKYQYEKARNSYKNIQDQQSFAVRNLINRYSIVDNTGMVTGYNIPLGSILTASNTDQESNSIRANLNYSRYMGKNFISAIGGFEAREVKNENNTYGYYGYNDDLGTFQNVDYVDYFHLNPRGAGIIPAIANVNGTLDRSKSYFANAAYSYGDKYTLSASGRVDGSNYFGVKTNQKSVPLWSVGGKWDLDRESFYHIRWLPYLKLRVTYGYQGNLDRSLAAITTFSYYSGANYTNLPYAGISNIDNSQLRWEKTAMTNLGVDFGLINNIIFGSIEYYRKRGVDLIGFSPFAPSSGITNLKGNFSDMSGNGLDLKISTKNLDGAIKWTTTFLFSHSSDRVTKYTGTNIFPSNLPGASQLISPVVGRPVYAIYSYKWGGLDPTNGDPQGFDKKENISKDYTTLTNPDSIQDLVYSGPARPTIFGGLYNRIAYKNISLAFNLSYKLGYYFVRPSINYYNLFTNYKGNSDYSRRWQQPGDEKITNVPSMTYPVNSSRDLFYQNSTALVDRGDHIRFQDISISYDMNKRSFPWLPINTLQFYLYANNIGIIWKANKNNLDPDYPMGGIPSPRSYSFGFKAGF